LYHRGARTDTSPDYLDRLKEVGLCIRQYGNYNRFSREPEEDPFWRLRLTHRCAWGLAQVRAAAAQAQDENGLW